MIPTSPRRFGKPGSMSLRLESLEPRRLLYADFAHDGPEYVPGELIVGFEEDVADLYVQVGEHHALETARAKVASHGLTNPVALAHRPQAKDHSARLTTIWQTDPEEDILAAAARLAAQPGIAYAEPNYVVTAQTHHPPLFPDDSRFSQLWGLHNDADADVDAPEAWGISTGSGNTVVAVIDSGINYNHPDLVSNIWTNPGEIPGNNIDDEGNGYIDDIHGWDFVNNDPDPIDDYGHGTHVSGTIGATGNNATGVVGVNWDVDLVALKFLDGSGSGSDADAIEALEYLADTKAALAALGYQFNVAATNNSWGGGQFSQALRDAIAASEPLFVAASGNFGNSFASYPARFDLPNVISVAATDDNDALAAFSNYGDDVHLAAPGVNILSTRGGSYRKESGTSMAAPHVTGAVALVWDLLGDEANAADVRDAVLSSVDPIPALDGLVVTGGRLNVAEALKQVEMEVVGSTPAAGDVVDVSSHPELFTVFFSHPIADGFAPSAADFSVAGPGGTPATADTAVVAGDRMSVEYAFITSPLNVEGPHVISLAAGAVSAGVNLWDPSSREWTDTTIFYDTFPLVADDFSTDAAEDALGVVDLNGSPVTVTIGFNEVIDDNSVGTHNLNLSQGSVTAALATDTDGDLLPDSAQYTVAGLAEEGTWSIDLPQGAVLDVHQNPVAAASWSRILDVTSDAFPTPLRAAPVAASRIYGRTTSGFLDHPLGDTDEFTLAVDGGQTVTVVMRPDANLTPSVTIPELGVSTVGVTAGETVYVQTASVPTDTTLTITLASVSGTGGYEVDVLLGSSADQDGNGDVASAQNIDGSFVDVAAGAARRGAVRGTVVRSVPPMSTENEAGDDFLSQQNDLRGSWTLSGDTQGGMPVWRINGGAGVTGNVGSRSGGGPLAITDDTDTYYFQATAGSILTASAPGFRVDLHDLSGDQLIDAADSYTWTFTEDGDYWIHVYQAKGDYTLTLDLATNAELSGSDENLDFYQFTPQAGEQIRLIGDDALYSHARVELQLLDTGGGLLATSTPGAQVDAVLQYTAPNDDPLLVRVTIVSSAGGDHAMDYGLVVLGNTLYDLEPNSSLTQPQGLPTADAVVLGQLGLAAIDVLWVGTSSDNWSDANFQIDEVELTNLPADLSPYQMIYLNRRAGVPDATQAASISAFVSAGGGLVTENGGDSNADFSWVPNADDGFTWIETVDDAVRRTAAGRVHPVTAGIPDEHLSNWSSAVHNEFPEVGTMTPLAVSSSGLASLLVGSHGEGRLAYLGMDPSTHQSRADAPRLIRQASGWAGSPGADIDIDVYSINLSTGDQLDLSLAIPSSGDGQYVNEWTPVLRLLEPAGGEVGSGSGSQSDPLTHVATTSGTYLVELSSADPVGGDYSLIADLTEVPPQDEIIVTPTSGLATTEAGGQDQFSIVLGTDPGAPVTIQLTSSDTGEGTVSPSQVVFDSTDWSDSQTVTVTGVQDAIEDGDQLYTIITAPATSTGPYDGMNAADVTVANLDDDGAPAVVTVDSINPASMGLNASLDVVISGANFVPGATVSLQNGTGPAPSVSGVTVVSAATIEATLTTGGGGPKKDRVWDVSVTNPDGAGDSLVDGFTVSPSSSSLAAMADLSSSAPAPISGSRAAVLPARIGLAPSTTAAQPRATLLDTLARSLANRRPNADPAVGDSGVDKGSAVATPTPGPTVGAQVPFALLTDAVFGNELSLSDVLNATAFLKPI